MGLWSRKKLHAVINYNNNNIVMLTDSSLLFIETPRIYNGEKKNSGSFFSKKEKKNKGKISKTKIWRD